MLTKKLRDWEPGECVERREAKADVILAAEQLVMNWLREKYGDKMDGVVTLTVEVLVETDVALACGDQEDGIEDAA